MKSVNGGVGYSCLEEISGNVKKAVAFKFVLSLKKIKSYNGENLVSEQTKETDIRKLFSFGMKNFMTVFAT